MGTWLAVFDNNGDVAGSISKRPNLTPVLDIFEKDGDEIFSQADAVVVQVDLAKDIIKKTIELAKKYDKKLFALVSNMSIAAERRDFLQDFDCFICNRQEAGILFSDDYSEIPREELKDVCRQNGMTEPEESSMFDQWGGGVREMCERGFINYVVQEKKAFCLSPAFTPIPEQEANLEMARRYFTHMGPSTIHDAMYYFHATAAQVKDWLSKLPVSTVECEGKTYFYIDNNQTYDQGIPKCLFLAGFDQLLLAHKKKKACF